MRRNPVRWMMMGVAALGAVIAIAALLGLAVMLLWNTLVPALFRGPQLQYWQAVGLLILCRLLFGGLRRGGWHGHWRQRMWRQRWEQMTPEERQRVRERFMSRCGHGGVSAGTTAAPPAP
ncbi:MAG TPA: hypothetical protein VEK10_07740 [Steroidobacteraceae bacterium]|nr:hypothetical protein [Steroidobacteraceae bacterium]